MRHRFPLSCPNLRHIVFGLVVSVMVTPGAPAAADAGEPPPADEWQLLARGDVGRTDAPPAVEREEEEPRADTDVLRRTFTLARGDDYGPRPREDQGSGAGPALGVHASTLGVGPSIALPVTDFFVLTLSGNYFVIEQDETIDGVDYDVDVELLTLGGTIDWHIYGGSFFVSGGAYWNQNEIELDATPATPVVIGGVAFTPAQVGKLTGDIEFDTIAPYGGIGFDNTHHTSGRLSLYASIGILFQGSPEVDLAVSGPVAAMPGFAELLKEEASEIEDELEDLFRFYPVATLGLRWRF